LNLTDSKSPRYLSYDHKTPRDPKTIVVTCLLVNDVKSDMSAGEFRRFVKELARYFTKNGMFDNRVFNLQHFKRN